MARENGYYWVKFEVPEGKWTILKWSVDRWWGGEYTFIDNDFEAIDERRIIDPDEQSNCNLPHVSNNEVAVCDACGSERTIILKKCGKCGNTIDIIKAN